MSFKNLANRKVTAFIAMGFAALAALVVFAGIATREQSRLCRPPIRPYRKLRSPK